MLRVLRTVLAETRGAAAEDVQRGVQTETIPDEKSQAGKRREAGKPESHSTIHEGGSGLPGVWR